jgi:hypothetical protein
VTRWALAAAGAATAGLALAQAPAPQFAAPVRMKAGDRLLGENRLYPSPVRHDVDGDGLHDIVVGDLAGRLTVALRKPGDGAPVYVAERPLKAADGQDLKFHNW